MVKFKYIGHSWTFCRARSGLSREPSGAVGGRICYYGRRCMCVFWWIFEPIPIPVTSLIPGTAAALGCHQPE